MHARWSAAKEVLLGYSSSTSPASGGTVRASSSTRYVCGNATVYVAAPCDALTCDLHVKTTQALPTVSSILGLQVPMLTQPTAKATWQVDTPPPVEAPLPPGKAGAVKAGAGKPGVQAPKAATPTDSGPLPSDALDEDLPSGPVRYSAAAC